MTHELSAKTRLTFESHEARLMIKGCLMLANDLIETISGAHPLADQIEMLGVFLKVTEAKIVQLDDTCEEVEQQSCGSTL